MGRLVDANEVVKLILAERDKIPRTVHTDPYELGTEKPYHAGNQMRGGIRKALRCIEQAPTVDAVPVVRCKDCKHRFEDSWCEYVDDDDNFYCARGERKEGADNG